MPELPEVETVRRELANQLKTKDPIKRVLVSSLPLRFPVLEKHRKQLQGASLESIDRHGKYLFLKTNQGIMLSHLGMTGQWRVEFHSPDAKPTSARTHDHVILEFESGARWIYNDPRRFGWVELLEGENSNRLMGLGPDPLDAEISPREFYKQLRKKKTSIKAALLDQKLIAGLGNIYVSEILFRAGVRPSRRCDKVSLVEVERILSATQKVLLQAIEAGGSSIRDYRKVSGESGGFQDQHLVYGRAGEFCSRCSSHELGLKIKTSKGSPRPRPKIIQKVIAGRATYWCPSCQK